MYRVDAEINFDDFAPHHKINYMFEQITCPVDLIKFVNTHYQNPNNPSYQTMITEAIKLNNLVALNILWRGQYYHTNDYPDFEHDVYTAVEYANTDTIKYTLYAYTNNGISNDLNPLTYNKLKKCALKNTPKVLKFIDLLNACVSIDYLNRICRPDNKMNVQKKRQMFRECIEDVYNINNVV